MLDPLTAVGLASNVVQLVSFARDLVRKGREIHKSADGSLIENLEIEAVTQSLHDLISRLGYASDDAVRLTKAHERGLQQRDGPRTLANWLEKVEDLPKLARFTDAVAGKRAKSDVELEQLCKGAKDVALTLLEALENLKLQGKNQTWRGFRQALNCVLSQDKIDSLEERLERYQRQINTTLLASLREKIDQADRKRTNQDERMSEALLGFIDTSKAWQADLIDSLHENNLQPNKERDLQIFSSQLASGAEFDRTSLLKLRIYNKLRFTEIEERHESIAEAFKKTFDWVFVQDSQAPDENKDSAHGDSPPFKPQWDSFTDWLCRDDSIYWLTGKPGSGKSTLMKYLYNDQRTKDLIEVWCGQDTLIMAGFFFWNSGTTMQMSRMGLIRSLLYSSIQVRLELIPQLFPVRWSNYMLYGEDLHPWTWSELTNAFKLLIGYRNMRFLYFIDGLDEFDGDAAELTAFILELIKISPKNLKMCVASRPWLVFEEAFGHMSWLRLEDLTRRDILHYVAEKLLGNVRWKDFERRMPDETKSLVSKITHKASGVFLWVVLVVEALLQGLRDGDNIEDLRNRLRGLPSNLEELFRKILHRLNPEYFQQACEFFQLIKAATKPLSLLDLSFVHDSFELAMRAPIQPLFKDELDFRADTMRRRLLSRCKGLLEAPDFSTKHERAKVQYLHRTVRDFFQRNDVWTYVCSGAPSFDPYLQLCGSYLQQVKGTQIRIQSATFNEFWGSFLECLDYAKKREEGSGKPQIDLYDELDKAATQYWGQPAPHGSRFPDWLSELLSYVKVTTSLNSSWTRLLNLATREALFKTDPSAEEFINARMDFGEVQDSLFSSVPRMVTPHWANTLCLTSREIWSQRVDISRMDNVLLHSFFDYAFVTGLNSYVVAKLNCGVSANYQLKGRGLLAYAIDRSDFELGKILVEYGADPNTKRAENDTVWDRILEFSRDCEKNDNSRREELYEMVDIFLDAGADPLKRVINSKGGLGFTKLERSLETSFGALGCERTSLLIAKVKQAKKKYKNSTSMRFAVKQKLKRISKHGRKPSQKAD